MDDVTWAIAYMRKMREGSDGNAVAAKFVLAELDAARAEITKLRGSLRRTHDEIAPIERELDAARAHAAELERFAEEYAPSAYEVWKSELHADAHPAAVSHRNPIGD